MKTKLIALLLFMSICSYAQKVKIKKDKHGDYVYQEIINVKDANSDEIYNAAKKWIAINYHPLSISLDNKETGQIICKGVIRSGCTDDSDCKVEYVLILDIKDYKIRVTTKNFIYSSWDSGDSPFRTKMLFKGVLIRTTNEGLQLNIERLRNTMMSIKEDSNDNW